MMSSGAPILRVSNLHRSFGHLKVVNGLDLEVNPGEIYGFLGVNGAGKTTTIRMLMGIIAPQAGTIELMGKISKRTSLQQKRQIGYVSQQQFFYPWMDANMLGRFVSGLYPNWDEQEYQRLLNVLEVPTNRKTSQLSGGMRIKLALAMALAPKPSLLILDEPTAGMDPVARREFLDIIQHQAREYGRTTFFSTHLLDEVERAADRVGIIHHGQQRFEGELGLLQQQVRRVFIPNDHPHPPNFELWKTEVPPPHLPGTKSLILRGTTDAWNQVSWQNEQLSLDDIFISCVGIETKLI